MRRNNIVRLLRATVTVCLVGSIIGPLPARAQEPSAPVVAPTITGPYDGCGSTRVRGDSPITFSGTATPGSALTNAVLRQFEPDGTVAGPDRDVTASVSLSADGVLSGSIPALHLLAPEAVSIALVVEVIRDATPATGVSNHLVVDRADPKIALARTTSPGTIDVIFTERVSVEPEDSALDWFVYDDETKKPLLVTGTGTRRVLRFQGISFGHDELLQLRYRTYPGREPYRDCVDRALAAGFIQTTVDGILPDVPDIAEVAGIDAGDGAVAANETAPVVTIEGLIDGHKAQLIRESNGTSGLQSDDHVVGSAVAAGDSASISDSLAADNDYTYYARAEDANGNFSDGHATVDYRLDNTAPAPLGARTNGETVTVTLDEAVTGRDDPSDWSISFPGAAGDVTIAPSAVEGTGDTRVLTATQVPNGARVAYTRPAEDGYVDEVGNELQSFSSLTTAGMAPTALDVGPELLAESVASIHETNATVVDDAGVLVPGATVWFRAIAGPSSTRDLDDDESTPAGVIGSCLTQADGSCTVAHSSQELGTDLVQGWVGDLSDVTVPEPRDASGAADLALQDVVQTDWVAEGAELILEVSPESSSGRINEPHVADVQVTSVGDGFDAAPIGGVNVDAVVVDGPNDGLHIGECITNSTGVCNEPIAYNSTVPGIDVIQYWVDVDGDDSTLGEADPPEAVDADTGVATEEQDPEARFAAAESQSGDDPDQDVVTRSWAGEAIPHVDAEPEHSDGVTGAGRTLRFTTTDETGAKLGGLNVDARVISGPNAGDFLGGCSTSSTGECVLSGYVSALAGTDVIQVWIDSNGNNIADEATDAEQRDETSGTDEPDQDVVDATWTAPQGNTGGGGTSGGGTGGGGTGGSGGGGPGTGGGGSDPGTTPDGGLGTRNITIETSATETSVGRNLVLSGTAAGTEGCVPGSIDILRRLPGAEFAVMSSVEVGDSGAWTLSLRPRTNAVYRAHAPADQLCAAASSEDVAVEVRAKVGAVRRSLVGRCDLIRGRVVPNKAGDRVLLQKRRGGTWSRVRSTALDDRSRYSFRVCSGGRYRVAWSGDDNNLPATSPRVRVGAER
jgi:hypothetical protein